jgi:hypothetical protein
LELSINSMPVTALTVKLAEALWRYACDAEALKYRSQGWQMDFYAEGE